MRASSIPGVDWEALGRHCSETERRADDASRDVENWLKCYYMRDHVGETFSGTITGVTAFGLFVTLDDYFVDGLVHISELGRDYFQFDAARHVLLGERTGKRFRLADRMRVKLVRVDLDSARSTSFRHEPPGRSRAARRVRLPRGARAAARRSAVGARDLPRRDAQRRARQGSRRGRRAPGRAPHARADEAPGRLLRRRAPPGRGGPGGDEECSRDSLDEILEGVEKPLLLVLDGVTDPHNLGACLRVANAAGAHAVMAPKDRAAGITPAVSKVASGAAESTPYLMVTNLARTLAELKERNIWVVGADERAEKTLYEADLPDSIAWVLGAEGEGMRRLTRRAATCWCASRCAARSRASTSRSRRASACTNQRAVVGAPGVISRELPRH